MAKAQAQEDTGQADGEERPRLLSVEIGDWPGLGGNVRLELGGWRTVLVGKNGAGKSLLMEGLHRAARQASSFARIVGAVPRSFRCELSLPNAGPVAYEYQVVADDADEEIDSPSAEGPPRALSWTERCWRITDGHELWRVADAQLIVESGTSVPFAPGMGLLAAATIVPTPDEVRTIRRLLNGFRLVQAGVPRGGAWRREILVGAVRDARGSRQWGRGKSFSSPIEVLARAIVVLFESEREIFDEFAALLRQLGLVAETSVKVYEDPQADQSRRRDYASVLFDGVNIGLLSDGTQRIVGIVRLLLQEINTCILVEEPETSVHPGLLSKLLALLESYGYDRQIVISTHSPQVVDWCKPEELRIIERIEGKTTARSLPDADLERVRRYLHEDGTFSEFVYEQGDL